MAANDSITLDGKVLEVFPGGKIKVLLENNAEMLCSTSGRIKKRHIQIIRGDAVKIELSPYDMTRGVIVTRL